MLTDAEWRSTKRLVNTVVFLSCSFVVGLWITEAIVQLIRSPIATRTEIQYENIPLPGISVCREFFLSSSLQNSVQETQFFRSIFFKDIEYPRVPNCAIGNYSCFEEEGEHHVWRNLVHFGHDGFALTIEACRTLVADFDASVTKTIYIEPGSSVDTVIIHDQRHKPPTYFRISGDNFFSFPTNRYSITVEIEKKHSVSQDESKCNDSESYDPSMAIQDCVLTAMMEKKTSCTPPWMDESERDCKSYKELKIMMMSTRVTYECKMIPACTKWIYKTVDVRRNTLVFGGDPRNMHIKMTGNRGIKTLIQANTFSFIQLVSDIGAIVTVVWGVCLLSLTVMTVEKFGKCILQFIRRDVMEFLLTIIFVTLSCMEVWQLIDKFASGRSKMSINVDTSPTVMIPSVTFCFKIEMEENEEIFEDNYYERLLPHPRDNITDCVYLGENCMETKGNFYRWKTNYHMSRACHTIEPQGSYMDTSEPSLSVTFFYDQPNPQLIQDYLCVYLHALDHLPRHFAWDHCHFVVKEATANLLRFSSRTTDYFSFCDEKYTQCLEECWVQKFISSKPVCDLPWKTSNDLLPCKNFILFQSMINKASGIEAINTCKCSQPCHQKEFEAIHVVSHGESGSVHVNIDFTSSLNIIEEEKLEFTATELMSGIGGLMSLFTGWSVLTIILWIRDMIGKIIPKGSMTYDTIIQYITWGFTGAAYIYSLYEMCLVGITYGTRETQSAAAFPGYSVREYPSRSNCYAQQLWKYDDDALLAYDLRTRKWQTTGGSSSQEIQDLVENQQRSIQKTLHLYRNVCSYFGRACTSLTAEKRLILTTYMSFDNYCATMHWNHSFNDDYLDNKIETNSDLNGDLYIHSQNDIITSFYKRFEGGNGLVKYGNANTRVMVSIVKYILPDCENPMDYSRYKCLDDCIHSAIEEKLRCRLPWNQDSNYTDFCYKPLDYKYAIETIESVTMDDLNRCNCPKDCVITRYNTRLMETQSHKMSQLNSIYVLDDVTVTSISYSLSFVGCITTISGLLALFTGSTMFGAIEKLYKLGGRIITHTSNAKMNAVDTKKQQP